MNFYQFYIQERKMHFDKWCKGETTRMNVNYYLDGASFPVTAKLALKSNHHTNRDNVYTSDYVREARQYVYALFIHNIITTDDYIEIMEHFYHLLRVVHRSKQGFRPHTWY